MCPRKIMGADDDDDEPSHSFIHLCGRHSERPPRRDAIYFIGGLSGLVSWRRGGREWPNEKGGGGRADDADATTVAMTMRMSRRQ